MHHRNLMSLLELITPQGWYNLMVAANQSLHELRDWAPPQYSASDVIHLPISDKTIIPTFSSQNKEILVPMVSRARITNPYSNSSFKKSTFDPYLGFFGQSNAEPGLRPTMHNAYKETYTINSVYKIGKESLPIKCIIYTHFQTDETHTKILVAGFETMFKLLKSPANGQGPSVIASLNELRIGMMPDLKLAAGTLGGDSFGVYCSIAGADYILLNQEIDKSVITDFTDKVKEAMLAYKPAAATKFNLDTLRVMLMTVCLLHELGHRVHRRSLMPDDEKLYAFWMKYSDSAPISVYGIKNHSEWIAECWAAWVVDGLSYSEALKTDFLNILFPPKASTIPAKYAEAEITQEYLKNFLYSKGVYLDKSFVLKIQYDKGPPLEISGVYRGVSGTQIPGIKYSINAKDYVLSFFPNRKIVKMECTAL